MKTKGNIVNWWCNLGNLYPNKENNDLKDFYQKIDPCVNIEVENFPNAKVPQRILTLTKPRWKYPIDLWFFNDGECVKIKGD